MDPVEVGIAKAYINRQITPGMGVNPITGCWHSKAYGGGSVTAAGINAAITAASNAGGGNVLIESSATTTAFISAKDNVSLITFGQVTITAGAGVTTAVVVGTTGNTVSNFTIGPGIKLVGSYSTLGLNLAGVQITNGSNITIRCDISDTGRGGVLFQGTATPGTGTPNSRVIGSRLTNIAINPASNGHGVLISGASSNCEVRDCIINGVQEGMGVSGNNSGSDYPLHCKVVNNTITMLDSVVQYEAIGIVAGCDYWTIAVNNIVASKDNGISCSASQCSITGNVIQECRLYGIYIAGPFNTVTGNMIRNCGLSPGIGPWAGIGLEDNLAHHNTVSGNTIHDAQVTPTTDYGVRIWSGNGAAGFNKIGPNAIKNVLVGEVIGLLDSDSWVSGTNYIGDIAGLTSAQIDALFDVLPADGTTSIAVNGATRLNLQRAKGKWRYVAATLIT